VAAERSPIAWALLPVQRYADFNGRAPRAEYWWYNLAVSVGGVLLSFVDREIGGPVIGMYGPISLLYILGLIIPGLAVFVRRLHDTGRSGWWALFRLGGYAFTIIGLTKADPGRAIASLGGLSTAAVMALGIIWLMGAVAVLIFLIMQGDAGANRFGPDPYGPSQLEEIFA